MNYQDAQGKWHTINNTLVKDNTSGYGATNTAGSYQLHLPSQLGVAAKPVEFNIGSAELGFQLQGAAGSSETTNGNRATYVNALPSVDEAYQATGSGAEDLLTLHNASAPSSYSYAVTASTGLALTQSAAGISITQSGKQVATIEPPRALDAAGSSGPTTMQLIKTAAGWTLSVSVAPAWLVDPTRQFPVVIDPNINVGASTLCTLNSLSPGAAGCGYAYALNSYQDGESIQQIENGLVQFNLSSIPFDSVVTATNVSLTGSEVNGTYGPAIGPVYSTWNSAASWNSYNGSTQWPYALDDPPYSGGSDWGGGNLVGFPGTLNGNTPKDAAYVAETLPSSSSSSGSTYTWNYNQHTTAVQAWVASQANNYTQRNNEAGNYGFLLNVSDGPPGPNEGRGYDISSATLSVTYTPRVGLSSGVNYDQHRLNDRSSISVNPTSQNGVYESSDADVKGTGLGMTVDHFYNTLSGTWSFNIGGDVSAQPEPDGSVLVSLPSGTQELYRPSTTGVPATGSGHCDFLGGTNHDAEQGPFSSTFVSPPGADADLCYLSSNNWYLLTDHSTGETLIFGNGNYAIYNGKYMLADDINNNGDEIAYSYSYEFGASGGINALSGITDTQNRTYTVGMSSGGHISSIAGPTGSPLSRTWTYNWDSTNLNQLDSYTDANGKTTSYSYNGSAILSEVQTPGVGSTPVASETDLTDTSGPVTALTQKTPGCAAQGANPAGSCVTSYAQTRPWASTRCATYGNPPATNNPWAGCATVTDADGHQTSYAFDEVDNTVASVDGRTDATATSYNPDSNVAMITGAASGGHELTSLSYGNGPSGTADVANNAQLPTGAAGGFNYSGSTNAYQATSTNDTQGNCTNAKYDNTSQYIVGNETQVNSGGTEGSSSIPGTGSCTAGSGQTTDEYWNDGTGAPSSCFGTGGPWAGYGELCQSTTTMSSTESATTSYQYDNVGNLTTSTPPASANTTNSPASGSTLYATSQTVDALSRVSTTTDGNGIKTAYWYDKDDRVIEVNYNFTGTYNSSSPPSCSSYTNCTTFTYDPDGNLLSQSDSTGTTTNTYDHLDRLLTTAKAGTTTKTYTYDNVGNLATYADQSGTVTYSYDQANNVLSAANTSAGSTSCPTFQSGTAPVNCVVYSYDADNRRNGTRVPGGVTQNVTYDVSGRATEVTTTPATPAAGVTPLYQITNTPADQTNSGDIAYSYQGTSGDTNLVQGYDNANKSTTNSVVSNRQNELTSATYQGHTWTYQYDLAGNRTRSQEDSGPITYYAYNTAGELCWTVQEPAGWTNPGCGPGIAVPSGAKTFTYDHDGNQTSGAVAGVNQTITYNDKNFQAQTVGSSTYSYSYAGLDQDNRTTGDGISMDNSALGVVQAGSQTFGHLPGGTLTWMTSGGSVYYYLYDGSGNVIGLVNGSGTLVDSYTYDPYGSTTTSESVSQPFRYQGAYEDPTGLYHLGARYYDPTTGRFLQLDPSGETPGYAYAGDNPMSNSDVSGLDTEQDLEYTSAGLSTAAAVADLIPGVDATVGLALGGASAAVSTGNAIYACSSGSDDCGSAAGSALFDDATYGTGAALDQAADLLSDGGAAASVGGQVTSAVGAAYDDVSSLF